MSDADTEVEEALKKLATGFYYTEEAVTNAGEVVKVERYEKPNIEAIRFLMKSKKRDAGSLNSGVRRPGCVEYRQAKGGTSG